MGASFSLGSTKFLVLFYYLHQTSDLNWKAEMLRILLSLVGVCNIAADPLVTSTMNAASGLDATGG